MPFTFAHLADCHLGAFRDPVLRELNVRAFEKALDRCMAQKVDFLIIAGDLFEISLPDMSVVDRAVKKLRELKDEGIRVYAVYGSHDYSPLETSVIDVLASAGLIIKVVNAQVCEDNSIKLQFFADEKTGAQIAGLSARKAGIEKKYYEALDTGHLEKGDGVKIFVFHTTINEIKPEFLAVADGVPVSHFPRGFAYYAGGHIHRRIESDIGGFGKIVYPGHLFGRDYRDLESAAKEPCGFYIVSADREKISASFEPVEVCRVLRMDYCMENKTSIQAQEILEQAVESFAADKSGAQVIVLMKAEGTLSAGKPEDIGFESVRSRLIARGASSVFINRNSLKSKEAAHINIARGSRQEIEERIFSEEAARFGEKAGADSCTIAGKKAGEISRPLLDGLKPENPGEQKSDYESRIMRRALDVLGIGAKVVRG